MVYNTRIAPSNTGVPHLALARTAYLNYLAARSTGGSFLLRIDDTDKKRSEKQYEDIIIDMMQWLGMEYDIFVRQSERFHIYRQFAQQLVDNNLAEEKDGAILLKFVRDDKCPAKWFDEVAGEMIISDDAFSRINGIVLIKSDGSPSYNFCSIIDDLTLGINYIIRGTDHISNTPKQVIIHYILNSIGYNFELPKFAHAGLICIKNKPMSKRDKESNLMAYRDMGYDPDAIMNAVIRMGWSAYVDDKTTALLPKERMLDMFFKDGKMKASNANFDSAKLESFNRKYKHLKKVQECKKN